MTTAARAGTWRELLTPGRYLGTAAVLAGGVALHATNIFLTTSLLPTAIGHIGGERLYAWNMTVFTIMSVISSMFVGAPDTAHSARYLLFGFAAVALAGCFTARRVRLG